MLKQLWNDESGAIITLELVMVGTVALLGITSGLAALRDALVTELADLAAAVSVIDQSFTIRGTSAQSGATATTVFTDTHDPGDVPGTGGAGAGSTCLIVLDPAPSLGQSESGSAT